MIRMNVMHMRSLYLGQLQLVDAIARSGNLSEAAEEVGLSQSAASHALARVRKELGDPVFVRTPEGLRPTPLGSRFAASASAALQAFEAGLAGQGDFIPKTSRRSFNVIMSDVSQFLYLPELLTRLATEAPEVIVRASPVPSKTPHLLLGSGEMDLAIGAFTKVIVGCRQRRLYREHYVCVVREGHPLFTGGMCEAAFSKVSHAIVDPRGYVHEQLDGLLAIQNLRRNPKLYSPYFVSLLPVLAKSDLMVIMASRLAKMFSQITPLKVMLPPVKLPSYNVLLFWHERFDRDPANEWLRNAYIDLFGDIGKKSAK